MAVEFDHHATMTVIIKIVGSADIFNYPRKSMWKRGIGSLLFSSGHRCKIKKP